MFFPVVGERLVELLKQGQYAPIDVIDQVLVIFAGTKGLLDKVPVDRLKEFEIDLIDAIKNKNTDLYDSIANDGAISPENESKLADTITSFIETKRY